MIIVEIVGYVFKAPDTLPPHSLAYVQFISINDDSDKSDVESDSSVDDTFRHHHDWFSISVSRTFA